MENDNQLLLQGAGVHSALLESDLINKKIWHTYPEPTFVSGVPYLPISIITRYFRVSKKRTCKYNTIRH